MTLTPPTSTTTEEKQPAKKAATFKPVTMKNLKPAPFYFDDQNAGARADKGIALKEAVKLDERQWRRRTPDQWGVLVANEVVHLVGIPEDDVDAFSTAVDREEVRLLRASSPLSETERAVLAAKHTM